MFRSKTRSDLLTKREKVKRTTIILLSSALALHLSLVVSMSILGPLAVFPTMIDSNGIGISFAIDSTWNRIDAVNLAQVLKRRGIIEWIKYPAPFHAKLYSVSFALFEPSSDFSILTAEPANAFLYLLILILVYKIGKEVCDRRTGIVAAAIIALWPSLLLHTTQFLREPQIIVATLLLVLTGARWLTRKYSARKSLFPIVIGACAIAVIWLIRAEIWEVVLAILLIGTMFLIIRQVVERRVLAGNVICAVMLISITGIIPLIVPRFLSWQVQGRIAAEPVAAQPGAGQSLTSRIRAVRHRYSTVSSGSNIDQDVEFSGTADIIRYLPRAAEIGFLAPFPNMWSVSGSQVGRSGRLLSGLETAVIYLMEFLAIIAVWLKRRLLSVWYLVSVCTVSLTAMGLVITNVSIIYRLRYAFVIVIIILGTDGARRALSFAYSARIAPRTVPA